MANSRSAAKRVRKTARQTDRNKAVRTRVRSAQKAVLAALESGDKNQIDSTFRTFASAADRAAKSNVIHKNAANRLKHNMALKVNNAQQAS